MNDSVPVLSLPIKTTLDRFTFAVFLVAMAAHTISLRPLQTFKQIYQPEICTILILDLGSNSTLFPSI